MGAEPRRISQLDLAGPLTSADQLAIVQGTVTKRTTLSNLSSLMEDSCECTLVSRYSTIGTDNNTVKKYLYTYTLPENTLSVDGSWLEIHAAGTFAANGNNKLVSVGLKQDSTGLNVAFSIPQFAYNNDYWMIDLRIQRSGETTYVVHKYVSVTDNSATLQTPGVLHTVGDGTGSNWTNDLQITVEATNGTASANDITCNTFIVEAHLLDPNS